jgi:hydrogenase expression/formation protein HypE
MKDSGRGRQSVVVGDIRDERIVMGHGSGGRKMHRLIATVFRKHFGNPMLDRMEDSAALPAARGRLCFTTDSYVVQPLFFPGGDIGRLAVCGTVNDLAVVGAKPLWLSVGFIIREGLPVDVLERVARSMALAAKEAGVSIVTGDTKVIERGADEGLYINTSGIGVRSLSVKLGAGRVRPGDAIILSGGIGEHEAAIAVARGTYRFRVRALSDCAPLAGMVLSLIGAPGVRLMRDPTRGGLATTLNEFAEASGLGFIINEDAVPVASHVRGVAAMLGLDPLYMANEGKVVIVAGAEARKSIVAKLRRHRYGRGAAAIGAVVRKPVGVWLRTRLGSLRPLIMLEGEQLPRIC